METLTWIQCVNYSQGGVKFPTGGDSSRRKARERLLTVAGTSRSGETPEPTVTVRKGEDSTAGFFTEISPAVMAVHSHGCSLLLHALILVKEKENYHESVFIITVWRSS